MFTLRKDIFATETLGTEGIIPNVTETGRGWGESFLAIQARKVCFLKGVVARALTDLGSKKRIFSFTFFKILRAKTDDRYVH